MSVHESAEEREILEARHGEFLSEIRALLVGYASADREAWGRIGGNLDMLAEEGSKIAAEVSLLPPAEYGSDGDPVSILSDLVQDCADEGEDPDEGSRINNGGFGEQIAYLLAYNGKSGIDVIRKALEGVLSREAVRAPGP